MQHFGNLELRARRVIASCGALVLATTWAFSSQAEEPRGAKEPDVLRDPAEITAVVDAFDGQDAFDFHFMLGLQQSSKTSTLTRETHQTGAALSSGGFTSSDLEVAEYHQLISRLNTEANIGLYQDLALVIRMPIILSDDRQLTAIGDSGNNSNGELSGYPGETLFSLPFNSPTRSGIEYLALGLETDLLNQWRDPTKPTWKLGIEGRFSVSEPQRACNENAPDGTERCAYASDIDRDGSPGLLEGEGFSGGRGAGVSRGTTAFAFETVMSKRIRYIEPYAGLTGLFEFQNKNSEFGRTDLQGALVNHPPFEGSVILGTAIMPWEQLENFQRVEIDLRFTGTYRSEGRDYSELFDALGSSGAASLREPKFSEYQAGEEGEPSVVNQDSQKVYMTGITDVQQHGVYTLSTAVTWHAGQYFKLAAGSALTLSQGHLLTFDQACNPNFTETAGASGPCRTTDADDNLTPTGIPNANYREVINIPGRRFKVDSSLQIDAWLAASVMF